MIRPPQRSLESGLSLVELVVGMVLTLVVVATAMSVTMHLRAMTATQLASTRTSADARDAVRLLTSDLHRMRAPARSTGTMAVIDDLAGRCNAGAGPYCNAADANSAVSRLHDITRAGASDLWFWADVASSPGTELVSWQLWIPAGSWSIVRTVRVGASPTSAGAALSTEVVARGEGAYPNDVSNACGAASGPRLFCYRELAAAGYREGTWAPGSCTTVNDGPWGGAALPWNAPGTSLITDHAADGGRSSVVWRLDRVVQVGAVLPAAPRVSGRARAQAHAAWIDIRNRLTNRYLNALLCARR